MSATTPIRTGGIHHQGLVVSDLDRSARFYEELFGAVRDWDVEVKVGGERNLRAALLRFPQGAIELFEYRNPSGRPLDRRDDDVGASHLCIRVDDIDAAYARLLEHGVTCQSPPKAPPSPVLKGWRYFMFEDPDGLPVELAQISRQPG